MNPTITKTQKTKKRKMKQTLKQYTVATDAVTTRVEAYSDDLAAQQFARSERIYRGCDIQTARDLADEAKRLGGWARVVEAR